MERQFLEVRLTAAAPVLRRFLLDHPGEPHVVGRDGDRISLRLVIPETLLASLGRYGIETDVLFNASARGARRRAQVGTGQRFDGGRIPVGLGTKIKEKP